MAQVLDDERYCRICALRPSQSEWLGELIIPCACDNDPSRKPICGRYVHRPCLDLWRATGLNPSNLTRCEACCTSYTFEDRSAARQLHRYVWASSAVKIAILILCCAIAGFFAPTW